MLSLLQLHTLLCASDMEKSPGRHAGGDATRGVRGERAPDTTLRSLLLKLIEPSSSVVPTCSISTGPASTCVALTSVEERATDQHTTSARSTDDASIVSRPLLQKNSLKLCEPIVAVVQSVFGTDFVPVRSREKTPAVLSKVLSTRARSQPRPPHSPVSLYHVTAHQSMRRNLDEVEMKLVPFYSSCSQTAAADFSYVFTLKHYCIQPRQFEVNNKS